MNPVTGSRIWAVVATALPLAVALALLALQPIPPAQAADTTAPYWPTGTASLVASQGAGFIRVGGETGWAEASDTPSPFVGSYEIYRDTTTITAGGQGTYVGKIDSAATRRFDDYGAIPGESYHYAVIAVDAAGNRSTSSSFAVKFLTTALFVTMPGSEVPHDAYANNSNFCRDCHRAHGAVGPKVFRKNTEKEVCYTCHDGTGSIFDVRNGSTPQSVSDFGEAVLGSSTKTSYHPVPNASKVLAGDSGLDCSDCHVAHKSPTAIKRLLSAGGPDGPTSGNAFCWACHGTTSSANGYKMGGNHYTDYYNLAAHSTEVSLPLSAWQPASGTQINCENCHKSHGTSTTRLTAFRLGTDYTEENLCYGGSGGGSSGCHGTGATKNMYQYFTKLSYHALTGTTGDGLTGAKVECSSCHGPHTVQNATDKKLTNPFNTKNLVTTTTAGWGGANYRTYFCNACHRASSFPTATTNDTTIVPATIAFPNVSSYLFFPGWDKNSYYYTSGHWLQSFGAGYDTVRDCTYCHDPHGTDNRRLARWKEESTCLQCHKTPKPAGVGNAKDINSEITVTVSSVMYLFGTAGGNSNFYRYDVGANSWGGRTGSSANFNDGTALVWDGGNYIYATHGGSLTFRRFNISGNTWENRASLPAGKAPGTGGSMVLEGQYIYYFRGATTDDTLRYDTVGDGWNDGAMAEVNVTGTPYSLAAGSDSAHVDGSDYIYLMQGNGQTRFLRYQISADTYVTRSNAPLTPGTGGQLEWAGGSSYLWMLRGGTTDDFRRYDIATDSWVVYDPPDVTGQNVAGGGSLAWDGGNYIYQFQGNNTNNLYRYDLTANTWSADLAPSGAFNVNAGGALTRALDTATGGTRVTHPIMTVADKHADTETTSALSGANRHSECVDCHDPHRATRTGSVDATKALHPSFTATIGAALIGAWGVEPQAWPSAWTTQQAYNLFRIESTTTRMEYQLCFRCHTYYAYANSPPTSPSGGFAETDLSKDFNINNAALHPVTALGKNDFAYSGGGNYRASLINGWQYNSRMTCTECHNTSSSIDATVPGGPHGSSNSFILKRPWDSYTGTGNTSNPNDSSDLCFLCHDYTTYVSGNSASDLNTGFRIGNKNLHLIGNHSYYQGGEPGTCINCHGAIPHGLNRSHFITIDTDPAPYNWNAGRTTYKNPDGSDSGRAMTRTFVNRDNQDYNKNDCQKSGGGHPC